MRGASSCRQSRRQPVETPARGRGNVETLQRRILVVDDDHEITESLKYALEAKGHQVMTASDGNAGLAMAERENPDLLITDMMMPKRSGFLLLEKLRFKGKKRLRAIMITANEGNRHKRYAEELLHVDAYIRKPFAIDQFVATVERILAQPDDETGEDETAG